MTSQAMVKWISERSDRVDRLMDLHERITENVRGVGTEKELEEAIVLRLATEFQGFCRDLHDECGDRLVAWLGGCTSPLFAEVVNEYNFLRGRRLDSGNAQPASLGSDFARFGMNQWEDLRQQYPDRAPGWNEKLALLNTARNGIAHGDSGKLSEVVAAGWSLTVTSARRWDVALDGLAWGMDTVCAAHVQRLMGKAPW